MKKIVYVLAMVGIIVASCNKEPQSLSPEQVRHEIDSLTQVRIDQADRQAQKDLELRIKIEVKVKADSIMKARQTKQVADTMHTKPAAPAELPHRTLFK